MVINLSFEHVLDRAPFCFLLSAAMKVKFTMKSIFLEANTIIMAFLTEINCNIFHSLFEGGRVMREIHYKKSSQINVFNLICRKLRTYITRRPMFSKRLLCKIKYVLQYLYQCNLHENMLSFVRNQISLITHSHSRWNVNPTSKYTCLNVPQEWCTGTYPYVLKDFWQYVIQLIQPLKNYGSYLS